MSERKTPILLRYGWISGRIYAVTRYRHQGTHINAQEKADVTEEFQRLVAQLMVEGFNPTNLSLPQEDGPIGLEVPVLKEASDA